MNNDNPKVKVSTCRKCRGFVRTAILHMMNKRSTKEFSDEAFKYNLDIKEMTLNQFKARNYKFCECKQ